MGAQCYNFNVAFQGADSIYPRLAGRQIPGTLMEAALKPLCIWCWITVYPGFPLLGHLVIGSVLMCQIKNNKKKNSSQSDSCSEQYPWVETWKSFWGHVSQGLCTRRVTSVHSSASQLLFSVFQWTTHRLFHFLKQIYFLQMQYMYPMHLDHTHHKFPFCASL